MKLRATTILAWTASFAAVVALAGAANAYTLRAPQVPVSGASLQNYLNSKGESINVLTDQVDVQNWATTVSGNSTFTLMIELTASFAPNNAIGVYNAGDAVPALYEVFNGAASAGYFAIASFSGGNLTVNRFDNNANYIGQSVYGGVTSNNFGFYLAGPGGTFYSQDYRNGNTPNALAFAGTGVNFGQWWMAWEDLPYNSADLDFEDVVLFLESIAPTPAGRTTFGKLKSLYR